MAALFRKPNSSLILILLLIFFALSFTGQAQKHWATVVRLRSVCAGDVCDDGSAASAAFYLANWKTYSCAERIPFWRLILNATLRQVGPPSRFAVWVSKVAIYARYRRLIRYTQQTKQIGIKK